MNQRLDWLKHKGASPPLLGIALLIIPLSLMCFSSASRAQEAYLVTYGPGHEVWELFGHNAIWIVDESQGIDHSFSFGYFDLGRPGFYRDFARGIMPYYGSAGRSEREFAFYRERDRDIRVQQLNLSPPQVVELYNSLHQAIFPQPQYYDYDYYLANCSTRLRDLLDKVTDGALTEQWKNQPATRNFRDHTRALTAHRYFMHTGIQTLLGPMIDQEITLWQEVFLPQRLADGLADVQLGQGALVLDDQIIYQSKTVGNRFDTVSTWRISLVLGLASLAVLLLPVFLRRRRLARWIEQAMIGIVGLSGLVIALMWLGSGHEATWRNAMLLVLNPLWLLWFWPLGKRLRLGLWIVLLISGLIGVVYLALPLGQYRLDALLWYAPLIGGLLWQTLPALEKQV